jgi:hypothetical protein
MDLHAINDAAHSQLLASLATLRNCIESCPSDEWDKSHGDYPFSQVAFHALFYFDYYLSEGDEDFKAQAFHIQNKAVFADYEELEDRKAKNLYERPFLKRYCDHCAAKADDRLRGRSYEELAEACAYPWRNMSRLELFIYTARHTQHHAAQLGLRLQSITGQEMKWVSKG